MGKHCYTENMIKTLNMLTDGPSYEIIQDTKKMFIKNAKNKQNN